MEFFSSSACSDGEEGFFFLMALKNDEAGENDVEEWRGGARQEPAHAPPSPTCHPLDNSATTTIFSRESKAAMAFFSPELKVWMECVVGLKILTEGSRGTPPLRPFVLSLFYFPPLVSYRAVGERR